MKAGDIINGENFSLAMTEQNRVTIKADRVREELAEEPDRLARCAVESKVAQIKTTRIRGKKADFVMPNFANATPSGLVDMLGEVREQMADLKKLEGLYKEALGAKSSDD